MEINQLIIWSSVIIYLLIISYVSLFGVLSNNFLKKRNITTSKLFIVFSFLAAFIPSAIRYGIGIDYFNYINSYYFVSSISDFNILSFKESGFELINLIAKYIMGDPQYIFVFSAMLLLIFIYKAILDNKNIINIGFALFIFMTLFYFSSYNTVRQSIAIGIVFYSYKYISERKLWKFIIFILLASLFHVTALFILPMYFILNSKSHKLKYFKVGIFIIIILIIFKNYSLFLQKITTVELFNSYATYQLDTQIRIGTGIGQILIRIPLILPILLLRKKIINYNKPYEILIDMIMIEPFLAIFSYVSTYVDRMSLYFSIVYILILPTIPKVINKKLKSASVIYIIICCLAYWFWHYIYSGEDGIIPYNIIFGKLFSG